MTSFGTRSSVHLLLALVASAGAGADWGEFRGPERNGIADGAQPPLEWSRERNVRWRAELPAPGNSSPVVVGQHVYLTCATDEGRQRGLYCFDRRDGKLLWKREVEFTGDEPTHPTNPYCGSSPAADEQRVIVWHASAGVHCYDPQGTELWSRDLGAFRHIWGYGSSPVILGDRVILNCGPGPRQFVIALDLATGKTLWQADEPGGDSGEGPPKGEKTDKAANDAKALWLGSWGTPMPVRVEGKAQVLVALPYHVKAFDSASGQVLWSCDGLGDLVYTDPLVSGDMGVAMGGYHGPAIGFRLGGSGDVTSTNRLWHITSRNPQRIGSGVIVGPHVFMANEIGVVQCLELATGREIWKERVTGTKIWGSIVAAGGRLYVTDQAGTTHVMAPNPEKLEVLATNELGEASNSTPAVCDRELFIRTFKALYCLGEH